jgi:hypothetical protein
MTNTEGRRRLGWVGCGSRRGFLRCAAHDEAVIGFGQNDGFGVGEKKNGNGKSNCNCNCNCNDNSKRNDRNRSRSLRFATG